MPEALVFYSAYDPSEPWRDALADAMPDLAFRLHSEVEDGEAVHYALVWNPPRGFFARFPNLRLVINLGAGVDALLARDDLPDVPVVRISDPDMSRMMASFVLFAVLRHARDIPLLERAQRERRWAFIAPVQRRISQLACSGLVNWAARPHPNWCVRDFAFRAGLGQLGPCRASPAFTGWIRWTPSLPAVKSLW